MRMKTNIRRKLKRRKSVDRIFWTRENVFASLMRKENKRRRLKSRGLN